MSQLLTAKGYWFGLQEKLGTWRWNDGKKVRFSKQRRGTNCMQLYNGVWRPSNCAKKQHYVCKRAA